MEGKGTILHLLVALGVVLALEQVALPGRHQECLEELAVGGHILEDAPARSAKTPTHDAQVCHREEEVVDEVVFELVLDEDEDRAVVGSNVLADGKRRTGDELHRGTVHDWQAEAGDGKDTGNKGQGGNEQRRA